MVRRRPSMILLLDNYDSFTWNLAHLIGGLGHDVRVHRNDQVTPGEIVALAPAAVVISPGPCTPDQAGISLALVPACETAGIPLMGVCLGHQAICQAHGGRVVRARRLMHGKVSGVRHAGTGLFAGLPSPLTMTRYHSLTVEAASLPPHVRVTAHADDDEVMAVAVEGTRTVGVQFHPESIASEGGAALMRAFLRDAAPGKAAA